MSLCKALTLRCHGARKARLIRCNYCKHRAICHSTERNIHISEAKLEEVGRTQVCWIVREQAGRLAARRKAYKGRVEVNHSYTTNENESWPDRRKMQHPKDPLLLIKLRLGKCLLMRRWENAENQRLMRLFGSFCLHLMIPASCTSCGFECLQKVKGNVVAMLVASRW